MGALETWLYHLLCFFRGYTARQASRKGEAAHYLTKWARGRIEVQRAVSQRQLLAVQKARAEEEAVTAALAAEEKERRRRLLKEQGRLVARQASDLAQKWQVQRRAKEEAEKAASCPSLIRGSDEAVGHIPRHNIPTSQEDSFKFAAPPSNDSLTNSIDLEVNHYSTLDIHTLDPFRDTTVIELLVQMKEEGQYPFLALHCGDDLGGMTSVAEHLCFILHGSAGKIQVGCGDSGLHGITLVYRQLSY